MANNKIPRWPKIYLGIVSVLALLFSAMGYFNPDMQFGTWEALGATGALSLSGPLGLYLSRNIATGLIGLFAIWRQSADMIIVALLLRLFTELFDFIHALVSGVGVDGIVFPGVMLIIDAAALWFVWKKQGKQNIDLVAST